MGHEKKKKIGAIEVRLPAMTHEKVNKSFPPKSGIKNGQNCQQATILGPWRLIEGKQHIEKHLILKNGQN